MNLKTKNLVGSLTDDGMLEIAIPPLQGIKGISLRVMQENEQNPPLAQKAKGKNTKPDQGLIDSIAIIYTHYKNGNMRFPRSKKTNYEASLLPIFIDVALKMGGSMGVFEKVPFFIKSVFGGCAAIMREINSKRCHDFITEIKRGGGFGNSDPIHVFRSFLMKHGAGRNVRSNADRAVFGQALMIVMDAWWYNEPLTLKSLEMKMQGAPKPMRFAPIAMPQPFRDESHTLMAMAKKKTA